MLFYVVYKESDGRIARSGTCPDTDLLLQAVSAGETVKATNEELRDNLHYIDVTTGDSKDRPSIVEETSYEIEADTGEISIEVPAGTVINYGTGPLVIDDGLLEFSSSVVGSYAIHVDPPFPYQTAIITVKVT